MPMKSDYFTLSVHILCLVRVVMSLNEQLGWRFSILKGPSVNEPLVGGICLLNHDLYKWALSPVISKFRTLLT